MDQSSNNNSSLTTTPPQRNHKPTQVQRRMLQVPMVRTSTQNPGRGDQPQQSTSLEQHMRNLQPFVSSHKLNPAHLAIAHNLTEHHTAAESVDAAFNVYGERLQADLRDFRSLCSTLVLKEQNEKEQWHTLCLKVMRERDLARQRVLELQAAAQRLSASPDVNAKRPSKRMHHQSEEKEKKNDVGGPPVSPSPSRDKSCEMQLFSTLRASPVHSPPGSPYQSSRPVSVPPTSAPPPESSASSTSSPASTPPSSATSTTPSEPPLGPPIKRRKSCEAAAPTVRNRKPYARPVPITDSRATIPAMNPAEGGSLPFEFAHVDLMYLPVEKNLVCRACLFESKKLPTPTEPTSFPVSSSTWEEMRDHVILTHPAACVDVARLHPAQIFELRRRLSSPNLMAWCFDRRSQQM